MREDNRRPDILRFAILVIIVIVTLVAVAGLRPLIFERVVPAVLGGPPIAAPDSSQVEQRDTPAAAGSAGAVATPTLAPVKNTPAAREEEEVDLPAGESGETIPIQDRDEEEASFPTARPAIRHVVQPGETLAQLASRYGVSVQLIQQANQLADINRITAGTTLLIPQP